METVSLEPPGRETFGSFRTRIIAHRDLSANAFELTLAKPAGFAFVAGQRVRLNHGEMERDYSLVSAPAEDTLRLCIRRVEKGSLSPLLASVPTGTLLAFTGPYGYFTFKASLRPPVFVATGTGIAPFCSMAASGVSNFTLLHGVKRPDDLYYRDFIEPRAAAYVACLSENRAAGTGGYAGRVTEYLQTRLSSKAYDFYLCGRQDMIRDATLRVDEGFHGSWVFTETFY